MSLKTQAVLCFALAIGLVMVARAPLKYRLPAAAVAAFFGARLWRRDGLLRARQVATKARSRVIDTTGESRDDDSD